MHYKCTIIQNKLNKPSLSFTGIVLYQLKTKRRLVYGAIAFIWIVLPANEISLSFVATDIVHGTCIPWGVYSSYAVERAVSTLLLFTSYLIPLTVMGFCYARIVYVLRNKVISCRRQ